MTNNWVDSTGAPVLVPPEGAVGFVYLITRTDTGRKYIGKKLLKFARTKVLKGKKKRFQIDSDWLTYYGSNDTLQAEVKELGEDLFKREILHFCFSKSECNYMESKLILTMGALLSEDFYNRWVSMRITKTHVLSALKKNTFN
jgi:hypothetical protein